MFMIGIGGFLGAVSRFLIGKWFMDRASSVTFPIGTWVINISGSFVLGFLAALHANLWLPSWIWEWLGIGFLGAYTTFSTFGYETVQLMQRNEIKTAIVYVSASVFIGLLFAWIGGIIGIALVNQ